ncbi:MAG: DUF4363 family protein [Clostridia bacterium]|nr:DUF4363 family protein [Clostridia bacterium]
MKRLIAAAILSAIVLSLAIISSFTVKYYYNSLTDTIEVIEEKEQKKISTDKELTHLKNTWEKAQPMLMFFANHDSVEEIGISLNRLIALHSAKDEGAFLAETAVFKTLLGYLKDSESLSAESVF